ncbi:unnamed protein product, partial [Scytosiphon promiscuus]
MMIHRVHKQSGQRHQATATAISTASNNATVVGKGITSMTDQRDPAVGGSDIRPGRAPSSTSTRLVPELRDEEPSAMHNPVRPERPWRKSRRVLVNMVCITLAGALVLVLTAEGLTHILGSLARITPLLDQTAPRAAAPWKKAVAGCTGPEDGFVYGGDAGNVLTYVRRG